jgi:hypothetical protein
MMICSSPSSSLSIWLNPPEPGWTISQEMPSTVGKTVGGFYRQFLVYLCVPWQSLGPKGLPVDAGRAPPGLHLAFLTKMS